jgi:hypothetical protein
MNPKNSDARLSHQAGALETSALHVQPTMLPQKSNLTLGRCAICGCRVSERNFGSASHSKSLVLWCDRCHAVGQQGKFESLAVRHV